MNSRNQNLKLGEAASYFLTDLPPAEREASQQEVYKFVRWFGWEQPLAGLSAAEVDNYAERLALSDTDYLRKLELTRAFLAHAKKKGWSQNNLAIHLKARKGKTRGRPSSGHHSAETVFLTRQGYAELEAELAELRAKRPEAIDEIRKAAATKDFRENAPLDAAKEERGQLEGRIIELEETLKLAAFIDKKQESNPKVSIGTSVILGDLDSGEELHCTLVSPRETDPTEGKISGASPIGRAIIGKEQGEIVEVIAPAGKLRYQIKQVES